jgi:hypothetical protein
MIPACYPQTWERLDVMIGAFKCLTWVGLLGQETHNLGGLKPSDFALQWQIEAK